MKEIESQNGEIRVFAGGKTVITLEKGKAPKQEGDIDSMFKDLDTSDMYGEDEFNEDIKSREL